MTMLGHNNGPTMEGGRSWRKHSWTKARAALLPTLPIEVVRLRVRRAKELGLPYKTYASVRASTGRDVVGFLFSSNALGAHAGSISVPRGAKLRDLQNVAIAGLALPPLSPDALASLIAAETGIQPVCGSPPKLSDGWSSARTKIHLPLKVMKLPRDGVLVIGETDLEREWSDIGQLAGYLKAETYFATAS
ncbi:hypothetical protein [Litoreibacter roseus]|uniref:Uncharacterized protein n=1 Tax=Litoreibacter roseus TaxID=2601869 RepID=A0A6N6JB92_9RHOB|nr:hypothetical protein [Litoreibacter roseus]GFE63511.1 hypothetical protein KIN_05850 [Litoreibacter roseus]